MNNTEIWKKVPKYNNYSVSNLGQVRNDKTGKILKTAVNTSGYYVVCLSENCKTRTITVHRIVLSTFKPIPNCEIFDIDHKDFDKANNCLDNLSWCTRKENMLHGFAPAEIAVLVKLIHAGTKKAIKKYVDELRNTKGTKDELIDKYTEIIVNKLAKYVKETNIAEESFKEAMTEIKLKAA